MATATAEHLTAARRALSQAQKNRRPDAEIARLQILVGNLAWQVSNPA